MKWKTKQDIDREKAKQQQAQERRSQFKGRNPKTLTRSELDELIILMAQDRGYLSGDGNE